MEPDGNHEGGLSLGDVADDKERQRCRHRRKKGHDRACKHADLSADWTLFPGKPTTDCASLQVKRDSMPYRPQVTALTCHSFFIHDMMHESLL